MEDSKIIDLFFARDEDAIGAVDTKYGRLCQDLSRRILADDRDVQECISDAYLGLWNTIPPQRPNPLVAFLCKLVRNLSVTRYHYNTAAKRSSRYEVALEELEHSLSAPETPETVLERKELTRLLEEFLSGLSRQDRVIFLRRYWFADSYAAIGDRVALREGTVSVRLTRLRKKLRHFLVEKEVLP